MWVSVSGGRVCGGDEFPFVEAVIATLHKRSSADGSSGKEMG